MMNKKQDVMIVLFLILVIVMALAVIAFSKEEGEAAIRKEQCRAESILSKQL